MLPEIFSFFAGKAIDKIIDGSIDGTLDVVAQRKLINDYEKIESEIYNNLITTNKENDYFNSLNKLLEESKVIQQIFNLNYFVSHFSMGQRKEYIKDYIDDFFKNKNIGIYSLSQIKTTVSEQCDYCFNKLNKLDDESRKVVNQLILKIADNKEYERELTEKLLCNVEILRAQIDTLKKELENKEVDLVDLKNEVKFSIDSLNVRYNKELNVQVDLNEWLNKFCFTENVKKEFYELLMKVGNAIDQIKIVCNESIKSKWNQLTNNVLENKNFNNNLYEDEILTFIDKVDNEIEKKYGKFSEKYYQSNEYNQWRDLAHKNSQLDDWRRALVAKIMLITGEGGIGKSHSIAHFIFTNYYLKDKICCFVLGQHLNEEINVIKMLEKKLHIKSTLQRYLMELNSLARDKNIIIPFVIEGINEGQHAEIWREYFNGLISIFDKFHNIKLIISIRTTYIKKCLPDEYNSDNEILEITHRGFIENEAEAVTEFFEYYEIDKPTFPVLYSEFYNPLFLHTLCRTIKSSPKTKLEEYSSFNEIFDKYILSIEEKIARKFNYSPFLKLVYKSIKNIIQYSLENNVRYGIEIDKFYDLVDEVVKKYNISLFDFVSEMIESGVFYTDVYDSDEMYVQFSYERYHNIISAQYLIAEIKNVDDLKRSTSNGKLSKYLCGKYNGIAEELFILIPEKYKIELLEILDEKIAETMREPFLKSLVWRKKSEVPLDTTLEMINRYLVGYKWYFDKLIETLLVVAPITNHPLNADFMDKYFNKLTMAKRDSFWIEIIHNDVQFGSSILRSLNRLSRKQCQTYNKETKRLIGIVLGWSLASTNNLYREECIITLVNLLDKDFSLANEILGVFANVNDPYVKEGIYCAVYGVVLRARKFDGATDLTNTVFNDIFSGEEVYNNIIVRAHGKGIIDYLNYVGVELQFDIGKVNPPYNSKWYDNIPTTEDIDKYKIEYNKARTEQYKYSVNNIIDSMATNTGERAMCYGDFGRYKFEGWIEPWEYHFIAQDLSNIVTKIIFDDYGYDSELHGEFDLKIKRNHYYNNNSERIGKKYQRIASFEMLARLADNYDPGNIEIQYDEDYTNRSDKFFKHYMKKYSGADVSEEEEICYEICDEMDLEEEIEINDGRKEVFIPYEYKGPWQFNYRGVDPTVGTIKEDNEKNIFEDIFEIDNDSDVKWTSKNSLEPPMEEILFIEYNNEQFVVLSMYNTWKSKCKRVDEKPKEYFAKAIAILVENDKVNTQEISKEIKKYATGTNNNDTHTVFAREFYWSDAYKSYEEIIEKDYGDLMYIETGVDYSCPLSYSGEEGKTLSRYSIPSKYIVEKLELKQLEDGKWFDNNGELICLDVAVDGYHSVLLIRRDSLKEIINSEGLDVAWGIYTEKKDSRSFYETRKVAKWDGENLEVDEYQEDGGEFKYSF